jgi:hypothetical protein
MCDYDEGMRVALDIATERPRIYISRPASDLMWIQPLYCNLQDTLIGTTIVAKINYHEQWQSGDYAAYMGPFSGDLTADLGALYVAHHGTKIEMSLAELLFRGTILREFPDKPIIWRR